MVRFERERYYIQEYESATVALLTNGPTNRDIIVRYSTIDGTARGNLVYVMYRMCLHSLFHITHF